MTRICKASQNIALQGIEQQSTTGFALILSSSSLLSFETALLYALTVTLIVHRGKV